jgi:hypothetical protein
VPRPVLDSDDRLEQQFRRLGTRKPVCVGCGESDPFCLELHHVAGRTQHSDTVIVCRNCHRKLSNLQVGHAPLAAPGSLGQSEIVGHYLLGLADLLSMMAMTLTAFGQRLLERARANRTS